MTMTSNSSESDIGKVFAIPELLEHILTHVPRRHLFVLQRVNKAFHDVITGSIALRRHMLLDYYPTHHGSELLGPTTPVFADGGEFSLVIPFEINERDQWVDYKGTLRLELCLRSYEYPEEAVDPSYDNPNASWRRLKLTTSPLPIQVNVAFEDDVGLKWSSLYGEEFRFEPGRDSLGDLVCALEPTLKAYMRELS